MQNAMDKLINKIKEMKNIKIVEAEVRKRHTPKRINQR